MQNAGAPFFIDGLKSPRDSQNEYHFASMAAGSKLLSSSIGGWWKRSVQKRTIIAERACAPKPAGTARVRESAARSLRYRVRSRGQSRLAVPSMSQTPPASAPDPRRRALRRDWDESRGA